MRSQQVKTNFSSGVMSPRVALRSDIEKFDGALEICKNWIVSPQGGIIFREGFHNFGSASLSTDPTADSRIFQFHQGGAVSDMIVHITAGDSLIHFMIDGVVLGDTIAHDYLQSELEGLWFTNQEKMAVIFHANHPPLYIEIQLGGSITGSELLASAVPYVAYKDSDSPAASLTASDDYELEFVDGTATTWQPSRNFTFKYDGVFATDNNGAAKEYEYSSTSAIIINRLNNAMARIPALNVAGTTYSVVAVGTPDSTTKYTITITGPNTGKEMELVPANPDADRYVSIENEMKWTETQEPAWSFPTYALHGGTYYQCILAHTPILVTNEPPNATYWTDVGAGKPDSFDWQYPSGNAWAADVSGGTRVSYSPGDRGFPTVGVIHQQRLLPMANPGLSMGVFGSRISEYKDFILGPQDDDPFFFAIDTSDSPTIKWATAQRKLIIGTSSGDYSLRSGVTITPSDVQAEKQNAARSHSTAPVTVNTDIFYVEQGKEKIRSTGYLDELQSQTSKDISIIAEHLLQSRVKRLCLMQTPEVLIFGLRDDGSLVCIAYSHEMGTAAWCEFESAATIIDICSGYSVINDEDELWALVTYDGGVTRHIEKMPYPARVKTYQVDASDDALVDQEIVHLDGWISGTIVTGDNNVITGLSQFEGLTITAMVDDAYIGQYTVNSGAIILEAPPPGDVPYYSGTYAIGFEFTGTAVTFEQAFGNPKGIALGTKRRWNKLWVHLLDSALPKINGQLPPDRSPDTNMSVAEINRPGLRKYDVNNLGWGDGSITILQDRPYPTHVLGFYGEFNSENA